MAHTVVKDITWQFKGHRCGEPQIREQNLQIVALQTTDLIEHRGVILVGPGSSQLTPRSVES